MAICTFRIKLKEQKQWPVKLQLPLRCRCFSLCPISEGPLGWPYRCSARYLTVVPP
ncbi:hypothetical protein BC940DRAFT_300396 [Gongronella butleri]|nr:hypothetical protein BC940DRAFT_300396 [Gongronella butleri]